jgi:hypothetical protein
MDNTYYVRTFYRHALPIGTTENKNFTPMYNDITKEYLEFVPIDWTSQGDLFGAPSRNRT